MNAPGRQHITLQIKYDHMEHKIKKTLSREELSHYLHTLADVLLSTEAVDDHPLTLLQSSFDKLEFKCKREAQRFEIKLKIKTDVQGTPLMEEVRASPSGPPGAYKALKKRMQATLKEVGRAVSENRVPSEHVIDTFQKDVSAMIRFPDRGEPHYEAFGALGQRLAKACGQNRIEDIRQVFEALNKMKKDCHARYK